MNIKKKDQPYTSQLKGVAALLGDIPASKALQQVAVCDVIPSSKQPRSYFSPQKQEQLAQSIKSHGILEPLIVRPLPGGKYEIVAGERRYRAAIEVGLTEVPIISKTLNDSEALQLSLIENLQRVDLNPVEETQGFINLLAIALNISSEEAIQLLYRMHNETKGKVTQNVLGSVEGQTILGVFHTIGTIAWESFVTTRLPLLKLPSEILKALKKGQIAYTKAIAIAKVKDIEQRNNLLEEAVKQQLSLSEIKNRIKDLTQSTSPDTVLTPSQILDQTYRRLKKSKLWKNDRTWKKVQTLLKKLDNLIEQEIQEEPETKNVNKNT